MSVAVKHLSKIYGNQKAVDDISFEISSGEITGFLGPNGAGKSTTMKMITGFIPPSEGSVHVGGMDISKQANEVRALIGYLPEHNPLYGDMYVVEYLEFVASLHKISKPQQRISEMIERTGLIPERRKKISQLSKGYKQRVGLAQAILHNPQVIILDEPTSGLDPNQLAEIRKLIVELGKNKTLILSTHIMQEVQAMCSRVIIINKGKIVTDDKTHNLKTAIMQRSSVRVQFKQAVRWEDVMKIHGVEHASQEAEQLWQLSTQSDIDLRESVSDFAGKNGYTLLRLEMVENSLEEIFKQVTK